MQDIDNEKNTAAYMKMSRSWLRNSRVRGDGPTYLKIGRSVRYTRADIDQYLVERRFKNTIYLDRSSCYRKRNDA